MPEVITVLSGAKASYATSPRLIPSATFTILEHEGQVTLTVYGTSIGDNYARYAMIRVDGVELKGYRQWVVSSNFTYTTQLDLTPGTHTLEVDITSYVGHWEVSANVEYTPIEIVTLPPVILDSSISTLTITEGDHQIVFATAEDIDPSSYEITVNGLTHESGQWSVSPMRLEYDCFELLEGTHTITINFIDQSGLHSQKTTAVVVAPRGDNGVEDIDILPIIIIAGVGIITTVGTWFLTDGFTKIPDLTQIFSEIQLPF